jgi:Flp pilus assembly protein TadG
VRRLDERGSAVVDFVLVMVILIPLFLGILQVALVLHVRNTLTAAASDGARYGATRGHSSADAVERTRQEIAGALSGRFTQQLTAAVEDVDGVPMVVVHAEADVPALGLWGPGLHLEVAGHAVQEPQ